MKTFGTSFPQPYAAAYSRCSSFSPTTWPFHDSVASSDSRCGIAITFCGSSSCLPPDLERERAGRSLHCASAAIFIR